MKDSETSITMVRTIDAPAREVYAAWTDPRLVLRWLAPGAYDESRVAFDARVGGRYRFEVEGDGGERHVTTGEYLELVPERRIVKTWVYSGPLREFVGEETHLTVELRPLGPDRTELTLTHARLPSDGYRRSVTGGWAECLDSLAQALAPASEARA